MRRFLRTLALVLLSALPALAAGGPLVRIHHMGRLLDASDNPVQGEHDFAFAIHTSAGLDPAVPDEAVWTGTYGHVRILNGVYSVELGSTEGGAKELPAQVLSTGQDLWIGVSIDNGAELKPRLRLSSVPLAARAASADTLAGELPASFHDAAKLTGVAPLAALGPAVEAARAYTDGQVAPLATGASVTQALADAKAYTDTKAAGYLPLTGGALGGTSANASAILDLSVTNKGFLPPRVTTAQRDAIANPAKGLVVYNTTTDALNVYNGGWIELGPSAGAPATVYASVAAFKAAGGYAYFPLTEAGPRAYDRVDPTRYVEGNARQVAGYYDAGARYFDDYPDQMRGPAGKWLTGDAAHTFVITFRAWAYPGAIGSLASLGYVEGQSRNHSVALNGAGKLGGGFYSDDYWNALDAQQQAIGFDTWVQAAWAYNPTDHKVSLYRNGVLVGAVTGAAGATAKNFTNDFTIGGWVHTNGTYPAEKQTKTSIAEVALFNTTLDANAISALYSQGFAAKKRMLAP